ncbi:hypothetical protein [Lysinibacillus sp. Bpr_S20]|uniref:hypothetical protein n=1 Tax=Lysinibacillus sp. Bpr_S20 TaxID=2933964 RepID=UPI0020118ADA|nr:hypothetical protein [Lysinibacillus sp. Bpr_S20]MCL1701609.1 hypothetical protein [Lysinibacillus sp. Bpr_S20]
MESKFDILIGELFETIKDTGGAIKNVTDNELFVAATSLFKFVDVGIKAKDLASQWKFEKFLKGFTATAPTEKQLKKLKKYIDSSIRAEFIADTFKKVLLSNSSKACLIMGTILSEIVDNEKEITHKQLICINALSQFYDIDLKNLVLLKDFSDTWVDDYRISKTDSKLRVIANQYEVDFDGVLITLDKAVNLQLLKKSFKNIEIIMDVEYQKIEELYLFNFIGEELIRLIERVEKMN